MDTVKLRQTLRALLRAHVRLLGAQVAHRQFVFTIPKRWAALIKQVYETDPLTFALPQLLRTAMVTSL